VAKWLKYAVIVFLFSCSLSLLVYGNSSLVTNNEVDVETNFNYINQTFLESSRFTQKDQVESRNSKLNFMKTSCYHSQKVIWKL
jgi:hypothetical protein